MEHLVQYIYIISAGLFILSVAPALGWYAYIDARTPAGPADLLSPIPFAGLLTRAGTPVHYPFGLAMNALAGLLDYAALAGIALAVVYCLRNFRRFLQRPEGLVAFAYVALVAFVVAPGAWTEAYSFARVYSPLLLVVGMDGWSTRRLGAAAPLALTVPRIGLQVGGQVLGIVRGLTGI